jgi:hypothetical protein
MAFVTVRPTVLDIAIANAIAAHTSRPAEQITEVLTWSADEHLLLALTAVWWLCSRGQSQPRRRTADHFLLTALVASGLPHVLKAAFDQRRPDRLTVRGHWHGVPFSGNALDAFPSGHAVHLPDRLVRVNGAGVRSLKQRRRPSSAPYSPLGMNIRVLSVVPVMGRCCRRSVPPAWCPARIRDSNVSSRRGRPS